MRKDLAPSGVHQTAGVGLGVASDQRAQTSRAEVFERNYRTHKARVFASVLGLTAIDLLEVKHLELNMAAGKGLTGGSNDLIVKAIVGWTFE